MIIRAAADDVDWDDDERSEFYDGPRCRHTITQRHRVGKWVCLNCGAEVHDEEDDE